jgi:hypothetical protein
MTRRVRLYLNALDNIKVTIESDPYTYTQIELLKNEPFPKHKDQ